MPPKIFNPKGKLTRHPSIEPQGVSSYDLTTLDGQQFHFQYQKVLGQGTFGTVYLLLDELTNEKAALKRITSTDKNSEIDIEKEATQELNFYKKVYPNLAFHVEKVEPRNHEEKASYRIVMPLFPRRNFLEAGQIYRSSIFLLIKNCAKELSRIHELGIIHGDVKRSNVLISEDLSVYFIDYDWSYYLREQYAKTTNEQEAEYFPPERKIDFDFETPPPPSTAQDIYSFAYMVYELLTSMQRFNIPPEIFSWLYLALSDEPEYRPSLDSLIRLLERTESTPMAICLYREDIIHANSHTTRNVFQENLLANCFSEKLPYDANTLKYIAGKQMIYEYFDVCLEEALANLNRDLAENLSELSISTSTINSETELPSISPAPKTASPASTPSCKLFPKSPEELKSRLRFNPFKEFK